MQQSYKQSPKMDLLWITSQIQQSPIQSLRSLMIDAFITGYFCGRSKDPIQTLIQTLYLVEAINHQMNEGSITFEYKLDLYQTSINSNQELSSEFKNIDIVVSEDRTKKESNIERMKESVILQQNKNFDSLLFMMLQEDDEQSNPAAFTNPAEFTFNNIHQDSFQVERIDSVINDQGEQNPLPKIHSRIFGSSIMRSAMKIGADCQICYDGLKLNQLFTLTACPHIFHKTCLQEYSKNIIKEKRFPFTCPQCSIEMSHLDIIEILDPQQLDSYEQMTLKHYFEVHNQEITHCPTADCPYAFINTDIVEFLNCPVCHHQYCMRCKQPPHLGEACKIQQQMDQLFYNMADKKKFQQCHQCKNFVEKNQGCDHITCRCGYQFCYNCGGIYPNGCQCKKTFVQRRARNLNDIVNAFGNIFRQTH